MGLMKRSRGYLAGWLAISFCLAAWGETATTTPSTNESARVAMRPVHMPEAIWALPTFVNNRNPTTSQLQTIDSFLRKNLGKTGSAPLIVTAHGQKHMIFESVAGPVRVAANYHFDYVFSDSELPALERMRGKNSTPVLGKIVRIFSANTPPERHATDEGFCFDEPSIHLWINVYMVDCETCTVAEAFKGRTSDAKPPATQPISN